MSSEGASGSVSALSEPSALYKTANGDVSKFDPLRMEHPRDDWLGRMQFAPNEYEQLFLDDNVESQLQRITAGKIRLKSGPQSGTSTARRARPARKTRPPRPQTARLHAVKRVYTNGGPKRRRRRQRRPRSSKPRRKAFKRISQDDVRVGMIAHSPTYRSSRLQPVIESKHNDKDTAPKLGVRVMKRGSREARMQSISADPRFRDVKDGTELASFFDMRALHRQQSAHPRFRGRYVLIRPPRSEKLPLGDKHIRSLGEPDPPVSLSAYAQHKEVNAHNWGQTLRRGCYHYCVGKGGGYHVYRPSDVCTDVERRMANAGKWVDGTPRFPAWSGHGLGFQHKRWQENKPERDKAMKKAREQREAARKKVEALMKARRRDVGSSQSLDAVKVSPHEAWCQRFVYRSLPDGRYVKYVWWGPRPKKPKKERAATPEPPTPPPREPASDSDRRKRGLERDSLHPLGSEGEDELVHSGSLSDSESSTTQVEPTRPAYQHAQQPYPVGMGAGMHPGFVQYPPGVDMQWVFDQLSSSSDNDSDSDRDSDDDDSHDGSSESESDHLDALADELCRVMRPVYVMPPVYRPPPQPVAPPARVEKSSSDDSSSESVDSDEEPNQAIVPATVSDSSDEGSERRPEADFLTTYEQTQPANCMRMAPFDWENGQEEGRQPSAVCYGAPVTLSQRHPHNKHRTFQRILQENYQHFTGPPGSDPRVIPPKVTEHEARMKAAADARGNLAPPHHQFLQHHVNIRGYPLEYPHWYGCDAQCDVVKDSDM